METFQLGKFTVELVDNPATSLAPQQREALIRQSIPVARKGFRNETVTESDIVTHVIEVSTGVYVKDICGNVIGFSGCVPENVLDRTVIHLKGTVILPEYQGAGFYGLLTAVRVLCEAELHDASRLLIGTRTQSPFVYRFMSRKLGLYPKVGEPTPEEIKPVAKMYAALVREKHSDFRSKYGLEFEEDTLIIRRAYGMVDKDGNESGFCMYSNNIPWCRDDEAVNQFMRDRLNLANGDAVLLIGPFSRERNLEMLREAAARLVTYDYDIGIVRRFRG